MRLLLATLVLLLFCFCGLTDYESSWLRFTLGFLIGLTWGRELSAWLRERGI